MEALSWTQDREAVRASGEWCVLELGWLKAEPPFLFSGCVSLGSKLSLSKLCSFKYPYSKELSGLKSTI